MGRLPRATGDAGGSGGAEWALRVLDGGGGLVSGEGRGRGDGGLILGRGATKAMRRTPNARAAGRPSGWK